MYYNGKSNLFNSRFTQGVDYPKCITPEFSIYFKSDTGNKCYASEGVCEFMQEDPVIENTTSQKENTIKYNMDMSKTLEDYYAGVATNNKLKSGLSKDDVECLALGVPNKKEREVFEEALDQYNEDEMVKYFEKFIEESADNLERIKLRGDEGDCERKEGAESLSQDPLEELLNRINDGGGTVQEVTIEKENYNLKEFLDSLALEEASLQMDELLKVNVEEVAEEEPEISISFTESEIHTIATVLGFVAGDEETYKVLSKIDKHVDEEHLEGSFEDVFLIDESGDEASMYDNGLSLVFRD